jgi:hypothetical protein
MIEHSSINTHSITLWSVGDRFPFGRFAEIHSRHIKIINFLDRDSVISVTTDPSLSGACCVVLTNLEPERLKTIEHLPGKLILNGKEVVAYNEQQIYFSVLPAIECCPEDISQKIEHLKTIFRKTAPEKSLAFLFDKDQQPSAEMKLPDSDRTDSGEDNSFQLEFRKRMNRAYSYLLSGNYQKGVCSFRGCGYGLTPSGDDFLIGFLLGLSFQQHYNSGVRTDKYPALKTNLCRLAKGKNLLVNTLLLQAAEGNYNAAWKSFLTDLLISSHIPVELLSENSRELNRENPVSARGNLPSSYKRLMTVGETSGADMMTGFLSSYEMKPFN